MTNTPENQTNIHLKMLQFLEHTLAYERNTKEFIGKFISTIIFSALSLTFFFLAIFSFIFVESNIFVIMIFATLISLWNAFLPYGLDNIMFFNKEDITLKKEFLTLVYKLFFVKHKNTKRNIHSNLFYYLFSKNNMQDNFSFFKKISSANLALRKEIDAAFVAYIQNNYKKFSKDEIDFIIELYKDYYISYNNAMAISFDKFDQLEATLIHYQKNREQILLQDNLSNF